MPTKSKNPAFAKASAGKQKSRLHLPKALADGGQAKVKKAILSTQDKKSSLWQKITTPKTLTILIAIVAAALLFYFKGLFVAAVVNGVPISRFTVTSELEKRSGKQILSSLVAQALIFQEAKKRQISVSQKEIEIAIKKVEDSLKSQGQDLDQALTIQGLTRKDLTEQVKIQKLIEKMFAKEAGITDKEISDYIEKNKDAIQTNLTGENLNNTVRQQLEQQKISTAFQAWLANAQKNAKIQYFVNY